MRRTPYVLVMVLSLAGVTTASIAAARRDREELLQRFRQEQARVCNDAARAVAARVAAVDRDGRLLSDLIRRAEARRRSDRAGEPATSADDGEVLATFRAFAIATNPYRALLSAGTAGGGGTRVSALDPVLDRDSAAIILDASLRLAERLAASAAPQLVEARSVRDAPFWLLGRKVSATRSLVLALDVDSLLADVLPAAPVAGRLLIADPTATTWTSCASAASCRSYPMAVGPAELGEGQVPDRPVPPSPILESSAKRVLWALAEASTAAGPFRVALVAPTDLLEQQQSTALWHLLLTGAAAVSVVLVFGGLALRQQLTAVALTARLRSAEELAHARERSDKILDNAPLGIVGISREGRAVFANRFLRRRLTSDAESGAHAAEIPAALGRWLDAVRDLTTGALSSGRIASVSGSEVTTDVTGMQDIEARVVPLDHPIEDLAALILIQDLSVVRELERQLIRAEKLITVGVLSAGIAHELGTPLMVVRGRAEHLLEATESDQPLREDLQAIVDQIDGVTATIRRVLDFARPQQPSTRPTAVRQRAAAAIALLRWRLAKRRIAVQIAEAEPGLSIAADPQQLEQVFVNLLTNAADASADGAEIRVHIASAGDRAGFVRIAVEDRGSGIAPEQLNAIFDPYFTTKPLGKGTGLGLAVVARIVRSHGAQIAMRSAPGAGTTAVIDWPAAAAAADPGDVTTSGRIRNITET